MRVQLRRVSNSRIMLAQKGHENVPQACKVCSVTLVDFELKTLVPRALEQVHSRFKPYIFAGGGDGESTPGSSKALASALGLKRVDDDGGDDEDAVAAVAADGSEGTPVTPTKSR